MRISRVYFDGAMATDATLKLPADASHYLAKVLRLRADDQLRIFNGRDGEFLARITQVKKSEVELLLERQLVAPNSAEQDPLKIHLGLGLSRGDRMDFAIQKSTELGVSVISPLYTEHGEVKFKADRVEKKLQHWRKIAISASEQCGRLDVPVINPPGTLIDWQQDNAADFNFMLDPSGEDKLPPVGEQIQSAVLNLLIGPEGGFAKREIESAAANGFSVVALGQRILRTETAPIAALAILQHLYGDM